MSTEHSTPLIGFAKPCYINNVLRYFLTEKCHATVDHTISRTEVTKILNTYIVANNLRDPVDKRRILYDKDPEFAELITLPANCPLTYFNFQSAIKDLFTDSINKMSTAMQKEIANKYVEKQHRPGGEMYVVAMENFNSLIHHSVQDSK